MKFQEFDSAEHALASGSFLGLALRQGMALTPVMKDGEYTPRMKIQDTSLGEGWEVYLTVEAPVRVEPKPKAKTGYISLDCRDSKHSACDICDGCPCHDKQASS